MSDQYPSPDHQYDTTALNRPQPPVDQSAQPGADWVLPGEPVGRSNPEADYWAGKYRHQRTWTRVLAAVASVAVLGMVGLGFAALGATSGSDVTAAGSSAAVPGTTTPDGTVPNGTAPNGTLPDGTTPDGTTPDTTTPDGTTPDGTTPDSTLPLDSLPLPDSLKSLAGVLGITDVSQLLDLAVANGMLSEQDAANLAAAIQGGSALGDLLGGSDDPTAQGGQPSGPAA